MDAHYIPKTGISSNPTNYRPITALPAISKIIERAVYNQMIYHLESYGLLDGRQHGFRKDHSTSSAIHTLVQDIYSSIDNRSTIMCVFIDYSKAFDTIDYEILCKKLEYYGMGDDIISWCRSYLSNRKQCVKNCEHISDEQDVTCGVPQGSVLGPLFFIIYVNDIISLFDHTGPKILLYADDTVLYYSHLNITFAQKQLNTGLKKIWDWCKLNRLTINSAKTKYICINEKIQTQTRSMPVQLKLGETVLERVQSYNYLGVVIDDNITFEKFMKEKCRRVNERIYQLGKLRKYITSGIMNIIYKQAIIPLIDYADFLIAVDQHTM